MIRSNYYDLMVWIDDGAGGGTAGDGIANGTEVRTVYTADSGNYRSLSSASGISTNAAGNLAVAFLEDEYGYIYYMKLWVDDGAGGGTAGDLQVNGSEVRDIFSTDYISNYFSLSRDAGGMLGLSFFDEYNYELKYWLDDGLGGATAGDSIVNGTELRTDSSLEQEGQYPSLHFYDGTKFAISHHGEVDYYESDNLLLKLGTYAPLTPVPEIEVSGNGSAIIDGDSTPSLSDETGFRHTEHRRRVDRKNIHNRKQWHGSVDSW